MFELTTYLAGVGTIVVMVSACWVLSVRMKDASIVDLLWSLLFMGAVWTFALVTDAPGGPRRVVILTLVSVWAVRLSAHLTVRNWGEPEDPRYQRMRRRQDPGFWWKSYFTVYLLQGAVASVVSLPLVYAVDGDGGLDVFIWFGIALWIVGFVFEAGGDWQLARFKADPDNAGKVMDRGLWRYTRHPNYFGDATQWFAFWLISLGAGGWWTVIGPIVMTVFLLKVSGVVMLEKGMARTRPKYADYVARTRTFIPGPPRKV